MYERYFHLREKPFEVVPNPDFLYLSRTHKKAMNYFAYGLKEQAGFMVLTGEVGSGKTTLVKSFIKNLDEKVKLSKVFNTRLNSEQLISMINEDFGLSSRGKDKVQLLNELYAFLIGEYEKRHGAVLIIDEAQNLTPELLEEVRMLSNLETGDSKLLQIILVGQPELAKILSLNELRQLRQRISMICNLYPLTRDETEEYIVHRLGIAGNREAVKFSREALEGIYQYSKGIPRLINLLCNFLMVMAFTEETREIGADMVNDIVEDLNEEPQNGKAADCVVNKKALLSALGVSVGPDAEGSRHPGKGEDGRRHSVNLLLKEVSLRIAALEKEYARLNAVCLVAMNKKLDLLEKYQKEEKGELSSLLSTLLSEIKGNGAYKTLPVPRNGGSSHSKPRLFRRLFRGSGTLPEKTVAG
jgi:general secretion pathway protein A